MISRILNPPCSTSPTAKSNSALLSVLNSIVPSFERICANLLKNSLLGSLLLGHFFGKQDYRAIVILSVIVAVILLICFIKRKELTELLDRLEMMDAKSEEKTNG